MRKCDRCKTEEAIVGVEIGTMTFWSYRFTDKHREWRQFCEALMSNTGSIEVMSGNKDFGINLCSDCRLKLGRLLGKWIRKE